MILLACALTLMSRWDPPLDILSLMPEGYAQAFRVANETKSSRAWFTVSARWDSMTYWPAGQVIEASTKDGRTLESSSAIAMTPRPECRPILLGIGNRWLDPSELEHGKGGGVVLLVSFPDPKLGRRDIADVRVRSRQTRSAASPAGSVP